MANDTGLIHTPPQVENDSTRALHEIGITPHHQLKLGAKVVLEKDGNMFSGLVLSIDRSGQEPDLIVQWSNFPSFVDEHATLSLFRAGQLTWIEHRNAWVVDPSTV